MSDTIIWKPDTYTWLARTAPVYIALLPLAVAAAVWFPDAPLVPRLSAVIGAPAALAWLLAQVGRDMGYSRQSSLWRRWGGAPTTKLLRHRNGDFNPELRRHYHERLALLNPSLRLPCREEEQRDPASADHAYEAATRFLIAKTRDEKKFSLIKKENTNYGFRRNLWGLKPIGLPIALLSASACAVPLFSPPAGWMPSLEWLISISLTALLSLAWLLRFTPSWVRIPAQAYAERLFEACDQLEPETP